MGGSHLIPHPFGCLEAARHPVNRDGCSGRAGATRNRGGRGHATEARAARDIHLNEFPYRLVAVAQPYGGVRTQIRTRLCKTCRTAPSGRASFDTNAQNVSIGAIEASVIWHRCAKCAISDHPFDATEKNHEQWRSIVPGKLRDSSWHVIRRARSDGAKRHECAKRAKRHHQIGRHSAHMRKTCQIAPSAMASDGTFAKNVPNGTAHDDTAAQRQHLAAERSAPVAPHARHYPLWPRRHSR